MKKHHLWAITAITGVVLVGLVAAAASARVSSPAKQAASIKACVLLPDTVTHAHAVRRAVPEGGVRSGGSGSS